MQGIFPKEVTSGVPSITLTGREEALVEQHHGLILYEGDCIELRTRVGTVRFDGAGLRFARYDQQEACITGRIDAIRILPEGGRS